MSGDLRRLPLYDLVQLYSNQVNYSTPHNTHPDEVETESDGESSHDSKYDADNEDDTDIDGEDDGEDDTDDEVPVIIADGDRKIYDINLRKLTADPNYSVTLSDHNVYLYYQQHLPRDFLKRVCYISAKVQEYWSSIKQKII